MDSDVICGLDLGSGTVRAVVAEYDAKGALVVSGWGSAPSDGLRKGVVVNIEAARQAVLTAVEAAEQEAGRTVTSIWTGLGGGTVDGLNSRGVVAVAGKNREIGQGDVDRVIEAARAVVIPMDRDILHVLPQEFIIDDQGGIRSPLGMIGVRLEAEVHIVTASVSAEKNLQKTVERAGYRVERSALGNLAVSQAVLTEDEKELGVLLLDIGASTTDYALIQGGAPRLTGSLPIGGAQVTNDLSIVLKTPMEAAEKIKRESGCCWTPLADGGEPVIIPGVGGRPPMPVPMSELCRIIQPRMEELFRLIRERILRTAQSGPLSGGIVVTGGGSLLPGCAELAARVFAAPARIGAPKPSGLWPESCRGSDWSLATGLVLLGDAQNENTAEDRPIDKERTNPLKGIARWLGEFF